jgi:hypothetical protein
MENLLLIFFLTFSSAISVVNTQKFSNPNTTPDVVLHCPDINGHCNLESDQTNNEPSHLITSIKSLLIKKDLIWYMIMNFYGRKIITYVNAHKDAQIYSTDVTKSGIEQDTDLNPLNSSDLSTSQK